ncbi:MAG: NAD(P)/FAD-dependent oxidoreductase [Desulfuromonadales bacterium]
MSRKKVVIAGMGFGGLSASKALARSDFELVMVDRNNYHLFQPLLYQVATAGLEQEAIAYPLRGFTRRWRNADFRMAEIHGADLDGKKLLTDGGPIDYDYLIVAAGSRTNFFGIESIERYSFDLKQLDQAEDLRNQILLMFERASQESDPVRRSAMLTFAIVGGGPTGVEFAGALRELIVYVLSKDYPGISVSETRIVLIEAADSLLTAMPADLRQYAAEKLQAMGVEMRLTTRVVGATAESVAFADGTILGCHTILWSAGVSAAGLAASITGVERGAAGRIVVQPDLSISGHSEVFVIGDMACCLNNGAPLPMMAPIATQQGRYAARALLAKEQGAVMPPFHYFDKGCMATIGRSAAVATTGSLNFSGYLAWLLWLLLHLYYLIGFHNRLMVMINWTYAYWVQERQIRLITAKKRRAISKFAVTP